MTGHDANVPPPVPSATKFVRDSHGLPSKTQHELWHEIGTSCATAGHPEAAGDGFDFRFEAWHLGRALLANCRQSPQRFVRRKAMIRADHRDHYALVLGAGRREGDADGIPLVVETGEVLICDLAKPVDLWTNPTSSIVYMLPRHTLDEVLFPEERHGLVLKGGIGALLHDHLVALERNVSRLTPRQICGANRATRDLLAAAVDTSTNPSARAASAIDAVLLSRAKRWIEDRLGQSPIAIEDICKAIGISRSRLYRMFEPAGGVLAYAQRRRLVRARDMLESGAREPMARIAEQFGFADEAHFSRSFRRQFKLAPRDCRHAKPSEIDFPVVVAGHAQVWAGWLESLDA